MKKTLNVSRKVLSVFLAILMVLTSWVWLPGEHNHASAAAVRGTPAIRGSAYTGSTGAYGSSLFNGNLDRWFKFHNKNSDYVQIHYPSHIYLDKSETLQSAGYYFNVDWAFGNSSDYRILIGANALGDNSQWTGYPDKYYTMTNVFNNYGFDASVPSGGSKIVYNTSVGGTDYDLRIVGYGHSSQGSDGFNYDGTRHDRYVLFRSYSGNPNTATIYLMGTPNGTYDNKEYNTTGNSMGSYGFQQNFKNKKWNENNNSMFKQKSYDAANDGCSSYYEGQYAEMQWFVTVYDKSALNSTINSKTLADSESVKYTQASWNAYKTALNNAKTVLTSRETTQTNIDNAKNELESKYNALKLVYYVRFKLPDGVPSISPVKFDSGAPLGDSLPVPASRPGYKFLRWYVDNSGNGKYDAGEEVTNANGEVVDSLKSFAITQDWLLQADFAPVDVNYENLFSLADWFNAANGASTNCGGEITADFDAGTLSIECPSGASSADNNYVPWNYDISIEKNTDYVFEYDADIEAGGMQVHLFLNQGKDVTGSWKSFPNDPYIYKPTTKGKIEFNSGDCDNINIRFGTVQNVGITNTFSNIRLYKKSRYNNLDFGAWLTEYRINVPSKGSDLGTPVREGYTFDGWYYDEACTNKVGADDIFTKSTTVYSKWTVNKYTVTFNYIDGNIISNTYDYKTTITAPANTKGTAIDGTTHYVYSWSPVVETTVTGNANYSEELKTEGHVWGDWITTVYSTCESVGSKYRVCTVCNHREDGVVEKEAHTLVHVDAKAPTCTADGNIEYWYCSECSKMFSDADAKTEITSVVDVAKGHTPGESATCTAPQTCTVCGEQLEAKLGHTEATREEVISEATCGKDGSYNFVTYCSVCNEVISTETKTSPATGNHTLGDWIVDKDATCVTPGSQHKECEDCDYTETEAIPATGVHAYGEWSQFNGGTTHRRYCTADTACTAYEEGNHDFNSNVLRQMTDGEYHQYKCKYCDEAYGVGTQMNYREECYGEGTTYALIEGNASKHTVICKCSREFMNSHYFVKVDGTYDAPDCLTSGEQGWICADCNYKYTETLSATGHSWSAWEFVADGQHKRVCANDENHVETEACADSATDTDCLCDKCNELVAHSYGDATCDAPATCTVCGNTTGEKLGHDYTVFVKTVDYTCTADGYTVYKCSRCDSTENRDITKAAHRPEADYTVVEKATCDADGYKAILCSACDEELEKETIYKRDHVYTENGVAQKATCLADGVMNIICTNDETDTHKACTHESTKAIPMLSHSYTGDYKWNNSATPKTHSRMCVNGCNEYGPETECSFSEEVKAPTCFVNGYTTYTCTVCNNSYDADYTTRDHDLAYAEGNGTVHTVSCKYEDCVYTEKEDCSGGTAYCNALAVCEKCNTVWGEEDADNHASTETYVVDDKAATCTEEGYTGDTYWSCCDALKTKGTAIAIDKNAHTTDKTHIEGYVAPTCTKPGATGDEKYDCCNAVKVASTEIPVDASAHTGEANVVKNEKAATCTAEGYTGDIHWSCCGALETKGTAIAINKDAHTTEETYVDGYVAPTCTAAGATGDTKYKCCNAVKVASTEIPVDATAHTGEANVVKNEKAATCTAEGYTGDTYWSCCDALKTKGEAIAKLSHTQATREENRVEASCGADGSYDLVTYCSVCQTVLGSEKVTIPATGAHNYVTEVEGSRVPATCIAEGTVTFKCGCGATKDEILEIDPDNHEGYNEKVSETPSTCNTKGSVTMKCACGDEKTTALELDASNHESIVTDKAVEPTCTVPGKTEGSHCSACNTVLVEQTEIPASGKHTYGDPVLTKAPSANEPGEYTETCTACGDTVITKVFFADYSKLNEVTEQLNRLLNNNTDLTDEAEQILRDAIAEAEGIDKNLVADVTTAGGKEIKGGQDTIDALVAKLNKVEDEITDAIHDGSALVPYYSAWDAAVADYNKVDKTRVMQKYLDEAAALMAEIAEKKADTTHTQASATQAEINAATKRLNEITYNIKLKSYVAPDFSALENAIAEYNGLDVSTEVLNSVDKEMTEIKNAYADIKGDAEANEYAHQLQLDTLEARVKTILAGIADTSLIKPDYSSATASLNTVKALAEANKLLDGVAKSISDAEAKLNKIIGNASSNMKADQQAVDAIDAELKALIKDITDGKLVKPDYSAADEAIANTDKVSILTDEEKATIEGLKEILDGIKSNAASNKYDDQLTVDSVASQIGAIYSKYEDCLPDNHDYVVTVVDPKCGVDGYTDHTCSKCGYNYKDNFVTATTQHDWDEGVLTRPTATTDGYYTYTCMNPACGATKTEKVERADYGKYNEAVSELNDLINSGKLTDKAKAEAEAALNDAKITDGYIASEQGYVDAATTVIESIYAAVGNDEANFKPDFSEVNGLLDKYVEISSKVEIPEDVKSEINKIIEEIYAIIDDSSSNKKDHQSVVDGLADTLKNLIAVYEDCANGIHRDNDDDTLCDHCGQEYIKGADGCFCHKDNLISKIVRLIYSCISWLFGKKISCCPDMEFYFKGIGSLT